MRCTDDDYFCFLHKKLLTDYDYRSMSYAMRSHFIDLMLMHIGGELKSIPIKERDNFVKFHFSVTNSKLIQAKFELKSRGFINDNWELVNWEKYQDLRSKKAKYMKNKRDAENKKVTNMEQCSNNVTQMCDIIRNKNNNKNNINNNITDFANAQSSVLSDNNFTDVQLLSRDAPKETTEKVKVYSNSVIEVFKFWQQAWNHPRAKLCDKVAVKIKKALKTFSADELKEAIAGSTFSAWHNGTDPKNESKTKYDKINCLLRDSDQINKFRDLYLEHNSQEGTENAEL